MDDHEYGETVSSLISTERSCVMEVVYLKILLTDLILDSAVWKVSMWTSVIPVLLFPLDRISRVVEVLIQ